MKATLRHIHLCRTANMSWRMCVIVKQIQSNQLAISTTIWTPMSSVPKKADKLNLSLSLSISTTGGLWCEAFRKPVHDALHKGRPVIHPHRELVMRKNISWDIQRFTQAPPCRDHSGCRLSQWEEALQCNASSQWLSPYPEWFLTMGPFCTLEL